MSAFQGLKLPKGRGVPYYRGARVPDYNGARGAGQGGEGCQITGGRRLPNYGGGGGARGARLQGVPLYSYAWFFIVVVKRSVLRSP